MPAVLEGDRLRQRRRVAGQHRLGSLPAPCGVTASLATAGCQASAGWGRIPAVSVICMPPFCEGGRVETKRGPCRSRREPAMSIRLEMPVVGRRRSTRRQGKDNLTFDRLTREDGGQARSCTPPEFPNLLGGARFRGKVAATSGLTARNFRLLTVPAAGQLSSVSPTTKMSLAKLSGVVCVRHHRRGHSVSL